MVSFDACFRENPCTARRNVNLQVCFLGMPLACAFILLGLGLLVWGADRFVIGSNLWNLLAVLGMPALLAPGIIAPEVLNRDMLIMLGLTLALFIMGRGQRKHGIINRIEGGLLLSCFIAYQGWLLWQSQGVTAV